MKSKKVIVKDDFVIPKRIREKQVEVYNPSDELICITSSDLTLNDILIQIKNQGLSGYYVKDSKGTYPILPSGRVEGGGKLMKLRGDQLRELMGF